MNIFELKNISLSYEGGWKGLNNISLTVQHKECVAILGSNGSGKTTLLKVMDGLLFPQEGTLAWCGQPLTQKALQDAAFNHRFRQSVAFVFQDPNPQLFCPTVEEEIAFGPLQLGLAQEEVLRRVADTLSLLRVEHLRGRRPHELSDGEKKRVAIAAALAIRPDVLLLDEPTATLDPRSRSELVDILVELHTAGKTLITATNDLEIVPEIAHRAIILAEDKTVLAAGDIATLLADEALLHRANLIHSHTHHHGETIHRHPHRHFTPLPEHHEH